MALVSAHRGGAGDDRSLENTLEAFRAAIALGVDFVEFDVRLTSDGRAVISHGDDHRGDAERSISQHTYAQLDADDLVDLDTSSTWSPERSRRTSTSRCAATRWGW